MKHTEGKLVLIDSIDSRHETEDHPCIDLMLEVDQGNGNSLTSLIAEFDIVDRALANRIVACVNALQGVTDEELESADIVTISSSFLRDMHNQLDSDANIQTRLAKSEKEKKELTHTLNYVTDICKGNFSDIGVLKSAICGAIQQTFEDIAEGGDNE